MLIINLIQDAKPLLKIKDNKLVNTFKIREKGKERTVNNPINELKELLKIWNKEITDYYVEKLNANNISSVAQAYLPNKSIKTNALKHVNSEIIQFDFTGFYDSCKFEYFRDDLKSLDNRVTKDNEYIIKRLLIDNKTNGLTQGLPVSGALAGLCLIPFWVKLKEILPKNIIFTQYSDDLTLSYKGERPDIFNIKDLTKIIEDTLKELNLDFKLNNKKTRKEKEQYRKVTGVRINHLNQLTVSRKDYRFVRHVLYILSKSENLEKELKIWGLKSKPALVGKISYMRSIDNTGKINRLLKQYESTCFKHNIFTTWLKENNAFI